MRSLAPMPNPTPPRKKGPCWRLGPPPRLVVSPRGPEGPGATGLSCDWCPAHMSTQAHCTRTRVHTRAHSTASQDLAHTCLHVHHLCIPCSLFHSFWPNQETCGISALPGMGTRPTEWKRRVQTTGLPGNPVSRILTLLTSRPPSPLLLHIFPALPPVLLSTGFSGRPMTSLERAP